MWLRKICPVTFQLLYKCCIFSRWTHYIWSKVLETFHMGSMLFPSYGRKLSHTPEIHFPTKLKADLSACKLSTCAHKVSWELFFSPPAFSCTSKQWQYCLRDLQLWEKCVFSSATHGRETERLTEKGSFEWKVWKPSLFLCQVSGVVPASLHIHLSFLPMRCLFQPLPASFCRPSNSNWRPPLTASRPLNTHCIFSLPAVSLYQLLLLLTLKHQDTHRQSAICCLRASLCSNFLPQSVFGGDFLTSQLIHIRVDGFALSSFHLHAYISVCSSAYSMPCDSFYLNPLEIHLLWCLTRNVLYSAFIVGLLRLNDKIF